MAEMKKLARCALGLAAGCALALGASGCAAEMTADAGVASYPDYDVEYVASPPVASIEAYPHVYYEGGYAYYVNDTWYYHSPQRGWARFRHEPPELSRYRPYVQSAPPARRGYYQSPRGYYRPEDGR